MNFDVTTIGIVLGLMVLANRLVAMLVTPLFEKFELDRFWLMYIAWAISGVFVAFTQVNLFTEVIPNLTIGLVLTSVVAGGGANLLFDLTDKPTVKVLIEEEEYELADSRKIAFTEEFTES